MNTRLTKDNLFRPSKSKAESRADITDRTARAIIDAEAEGREAKTMRLRQARLKAEAGEEKPAKAGRGKAAARAKSRGAAKT